MAVLCATRSLGVLGDHGRLELPWRLRLTQTESDPDGGEESYNAHIEETLSEEVPSCESDAYSRSNSRYNDFVFVENSCPIEACLDCTIRPHANKKRCISPVSNPKNQVFLASNSIKMTIGEHESAPAQDEDVFSSYVDLGRLNTKDVEHFTQDYPSCAEASTLLTSGHMKEMKHLLRVAGWTLNSRNRNALWRSLCCHHSTDKDFSDHFYWETVQQIYGSIDLEESRLSLPAFVDSQFTPSHALSAQGLNVCARILSVLAYTHPAITYAPSVYAITSLMLHFLEEAMVYNCLVALITSTQKKFITQTKMAFETSWRAAALLAKKHIRGSFSTLGKYGFMQTQIEDAFQNWLCWIFADLPLSHQVRIFDCFLFEGSKVLLRSALALFHMFIKKVSRDASLAESLVSSKKIGEPISQFCKDIKAPPSKVLKSAFGIRGFSKSEIAKAEIQMETSLKSRQSFSATQAAAAQALGQSGNQEAFPSSSSQVDIHMISHTLTIKELLQVWSWLPTRMTMHQPQLIYTTEEHGCSLTTFFQRVEKYEPTILLIRTVSDSIFGAYISAAWENRNFKDEFGNRQTYFGTGETFLFTLRPLVQRYPWVGITRQQQDEQLSSVDRASELFIHADTNFFTVGGGKGQGLMVDHELRFGKTEWCQTFENEPLCPEKDFEIKVIEVYSLTSC